MIESSAAIITSLRSFYPRIKTRHQGAALLKDTKDILKLTFTWTVRLMHNMNSALKKFTLQELGMDLQVAMSI